jgi:3-oxoacyl-[acyl-carrier-protein] synthase-1
MNPILSIEACGAVTPIGLTMAQTYTAIQAGVSNFSAVRWRLPTDEPSFGARVPAAASLQQDWCTWSTNLAVRAVRECADGRSIAPGRTALLWCAPDAPRLEATFADMAQRRPCARIEARLGLRFSPRSREFAGGPAALADALLCAQDLLAAGEVEWALVGGSDSLVSHDEIERLHARNRIHSGAQPHGLFPAEGACCLLVTSPAREHHPLARVLGCARASEQHTLLGPTLSVGDALRDAFEHATARAGVHESSVAFICSNTNGERHADIEVNHARMRFFRTRREDFPVWLPSARVGDIGAASGALTLAVAAMGLARGDGVGPSAMCELLSEGPLRAACLVAAGPGERLPAGRRALVGVMR